MSYLKVLYGIALIGLSAISVYGFVSDFPYAAAVQAINIGVLLFWGLYLILRKKKEAIVQGDLLIVKRGPKKIREFDLAHKQRVVFGDRSMKIIFKTSSETFRYSEYSNESVKRLKALS